VQAELRTICAPRKLSGPIQSGEEPESLWRTLRRLSHGVPLTVHSASASFVDRHIGARREADLDTMLKAVGFDTVDALVDTAVPKDIRQVTALELSSALSEVEALA
jgi:hypothetical protein